MSPTNVLKTACHLLRLENGKNDLAKLMGGNQEEKASLLSGIWQSRKLRPSRRTIWGFAALAVVLQGLLMFKWFFYDQEIIVTLPYDVEETVGLVTVVSQDIVSYTTGQVSVPHQATC